MKALLVELKMRLMVEALVALLAFDEIRCILVRMGSPDMGIMGRVGSKGFSTECTL